MSTSNRKKQGQKYKNKSKFKLNEDSKLTQRIKATPLDHLCQRCYDQIKWKIDYKKYKPLSQPGKCTDCHQKNVLKAYRALCDKCTIKKIEIRVPREEALQLGIIQAPEVEEGQDQVVQNGADDSNEQEESKNVAEQIIPEEPQNEDEEEKKLEENAAHFDDD